MLTKCCLRHALLPVSLMSGLAGIVAADEAADHFEAKVRPLLANRCFECHGSAQKGGLRLDSREGVLAGGDSGPAVISGKPEKSLLVQAVVRTHRRLKMPPGKPLQPREVETIRRWIKDGVAWPESPREFFRNRIQPVLASKCFSCHRDKPKGDLRLDSRAALMKGGKTGAVVVPGDPEASLLLKAIRHEGGIRRMPPDSKEKISSEDVALFETWIRHGVVWDSSALEPAGGTIRPEQRQFWSFQPVKRPAVPGVAEAPPSWQRNPIDAFVFARLKAKGLRPGVRADARTLIRRLTFNLVGLPPSPDRVSRFEREFATDPKSAWNEIAEELLASRHYGERWGRHWLDVVRYADTAGDAGDFPIPEAFKYRNYVIDSFNENKPYDEFIREQIAGDLLPFEDDDERWEQTVATGYLAISRRVGVSPQNLRHIVLEDTIDNLGKTFLGLTIGCARCHDHKFDPIPTADYYALYGIFDSSVFPHPGAEHKPWRQDFVYRIGRAESDRVLKPHREELEAWNRKERAEFENYRDFQRKKITDPNRSRAKAWSKVLAVREARKETAHRFPNLEVAYAIQDGRPHDVAIQKQGNPQKQSAGAIVRRGFLQILGGQKLPDDATGSGRRELADWISDSKNPLTARVIVNRIWHWHFGRGLVQTTSDFGVRGSAPTHPELLDFLASWFVEHNWSIKAMHRLILGSQTWQLASTDIAANSAVDPENLLLWRANRLRLDAEQLRDSLLTFSGEIDLSPGDRHPFDHRLTYFYRQHEPFVGDFPTNRRSVYMMQQRIRKNAYLDLFDGPDGNLPFSERKSTTTTLQALFFMNSEFVHDRADAIARRVMAESATTQERLRSVCRMIFHREPTAAESAKVVAHLKRVTELLPETGPEGAEATRVAWSGFVRGMISSNEFLFLD